MDKLNEGSKQELMKLHGIGAKRAEAIIAHRQDQHFEEFSDLKAIGLSQKQIDTMIKANTITMLH